jgi:hypothetical protein
MTQDNSYAFASFAVIGGHDYEGETFSSMRIFPSYESALDYARDLVNGSLSYDYAYVAGVHADGSLEQKDVTRVATIRPSLNDVAKAALGLTPEALRGISSRSVRLEAKDTTLSQWRHGFESRTDYDHQ